MFALLPVISKILTTGVASIIVFGMLVIVHELGHFMVAKFSGIRVYEFSIGFGPKVWGKRKGETVYNLRALPLGGFVRMAGMDPDEDFREAKKELKERLGMNDEDPPEEKVVALIDESRGFNKKPVWVRMVVIFAGPLMNLVLAAVLFSFFFFNVGVFKLSNEIDKVIPNKPAVEAGLMKGDKILAIDGKKVEEWSELAGIIGQSNGKQLKLLVKRDDKVFTLKVRPQYVKKENRYVIGILPKGTVINNPSIIQSLREGVKTTFEFIGMILAFLGQMFTREVPMDLGGPVRITVEIGKAAERDILQLVQLAAFLSINLGLFNLFPIPALDGSRLLFLTLEGLRGRPINPAKENFIHLIGFGLLLLLMVVITFKDIKQLINPFLTIFTG